MDYKKYSKEEKYKVIMKILGFKLPGKVINDLYKNNELKYLIPELEDCINIQQNKFHAYDVYKHNLEVCNAMASYTGNKLLILAALLHDIGKPEAFKKNGDSFIGHERTGSKISGKIMRRLGFNKKDISYVRLIIDNHMYRIQAETWSVICDDCKHKFNAYYSNYIEKRTKSIPNKDKCNECGSLNVNASLLCKETKLSTVEKLVNKIGMSKVNDLNLLRMADRKGNNKSQVKTFHQKIFLKMLEEIKGKEVKLNVQGSIFKRRENG